MDVVWTDYMKYRAQLRGFELGKIERLLRESRERYVDTATGRFVVVGRYGRSLVMVPYELDKDSMAPITIHATTRQQIRHRLEVGRFIHEHE